MTESATISSPEYETVCGGKLKDPKYSLSVDYRSEQFHFCTRACIQVFEQNPDAFIAGEVEHPVEEDSIQLLKSSGEKTALGSLADFRRPFGDIFHEQFGV